MPIDWFTVVAQALNFVVLVWLLKRFLYGPVLAAVDAREKRIADELADAAAKQEQARRERDDFARRNAEFDARRDQSLSDMQAQVAQQAQRLLDQARQAASDWAVRRQAALRTQARQFDHAVRAQAQLEVFAIARKTLQDLASCELEEAVCAVFVRQLQDSEATQREHLRAVLQARAEPVQVRSAFALPLPLRESIQRAVDAAAKASAPLEFVTRPDLVCGIELVCGGLKIGWTKQEYLDAMEQQLATWLQAQSQDEPQAQPGAMQAA